MTLKQITPFVPCTSLDAQIAFYRDVLGFEVRFQANNYAYLKREAVAIRLVEVPSKVDLKHPEREGSFYIDAEGLDEVYEVMRPALDTLAEGRVRPPFNQDYGQREFHVSDEDCTLVFFGEAVSGCISDELKRTQCAKEPRPATVRGGRFASVLFGSLWLHISPKT